VDPRRQRVGGSAFAALSELIRSPYLLGVAGWVSLLSFGATIAYFAQANIVAATIHGAAAQTRLFAGIDLAVGLLSLATQVFATGRFLKRFGTGIAAAALPAIYVVGFGALAIAEPVRGGDTPGRATLDELRNRKSGTPGILHRGWAGGKI
jgi:AAA family ATP:ADP antiporter